MIQRDKVGTTQTNNNETSNIGYLGASDFSLNFYFYDWSMKSGSPRHGLIMRRLYNKLVTMIGLSKS